MSEEEFERPLEETEEFTEEEMALMASARKPKINKYVSQVKDVTQVKEYGHYWDPSEGLWLPR